VWLNEETVVWGFGFFANDQFCSFFLAQFDIVGNSIELKFGDLRTLVGILVKWISNFILLGIFSEFLGKLILDLLMDIYPGRSTTHLSLIIKPNN